MSEPLHEETEVRWLSFLNRFESEIWPTLFEGRGFTKGEALILWRLSGVQEATEDVVTKLNEMSGNGEWPSC